MALTGDRLYVVCVAARLCLRLLHGMRWPGARLHGRAGRLDGQVPPHPARHRSEGKQAHDFMVVFSFVQVQSRVLGGIMAL